MYRWLDWLCPVVSRAHFKFSSIWSMVEWKSSRLLSNLFCCSNPLPSWAQSGLLACACNAAPPSCMATPHLSLSTGRRSLDLANKALPASSGLGAGLPPPWGPSGGGCWFIRVFPKLLTLSLRLSTQECSAISEWQVRHTLMCKTTTVFTEILNDWIVSYIYNNMD